MAINFNEAAKVRNMNTGNLGDNPRLARRLSSSLHKTMSFGKAWDVGDQGTVFYPFKWWPDESDPASGSFELHSSAFFGHRVSDMKALGTTFLRSLSRIDENGSVIGNGDLAYQFSRIAGLLVNAEKEKELDELNKADWTVLGQSAYQEARKKIEDAYDTKNNIKAKRPLIGSLTVYRATEVVYVAMDPNKGTPIFDDNRKQKTGTYIQEIKDGRLAKLQALANDPTTGILAQNPGLIPEPGKLYFLEVLYNYTSANNSKAEAGRAEPQGVAQPVTILGRNPALKSKLDDLLQRIPDTADGIAAHTYGMSPMPEAELKKRLQSVLFTASASLRFLTPEDKDRLVKNARVLDYLRIAPRDDAELNTRLEAELGHPVGQAPKEEAPTLETILDDNEEPDFTLQSNAILNESRPKGDVGFIDENDNMIGGIDLGEITG